MKENDFKKRLVKGLRERGAHVTLIENMVGVGCPDLNIALRGVERWVETKGPASMTLDYVKLRKTQNAWMAQRYSVGGHTWIVANDGKVSELYVYDPLIVGPLDDKHVRFLRYDVRIVFDNMKDLIYTLLK